MPRSPELDLIIIGAPRSGTNILRDVLCRLPGFSTWPCDEINLIWRHGNARHPSDVLPPQRADDRVAGYIRRAFARRRRADGSDVVVEKTCANSLRVPFVDRVLPDARYVFIHRDPVDAVASATLRWRAPFDLGYTLAKARFVPWSDLPYYALRFLANRLHRVLSPGDRLAHWGPRLENMERLLHDHDLAEICALQWRECVVRSAEAFAAMPAGKVHVLSYEDFVAAPRSSVEAVCGFLGRAPELAVLEDSVRDVTERSVGKGRDTLTARQVAAVEALAQPARTALRRLAASATSAPRPSARGNRAP